MEKTSRFQQMTRATQKTGERRGSGRTKAGRGGGGLGGGGTQPKKGYGKKRGEEKIADKSVKREREQNKP